MIPLFWIGASAIAGAAATQLATDSDESPISPAGFFTPKTIFIIGTVAITTHLITKKLS